MKDITVLENKDKRSRRRKSRKRKRVRMSERIKRQRERQQEQEGHWGWTWYIDSQRPGEREDSWQHFDTTKARSTPLLPSCRRRVGRVREPYRCVRVRQRDCVCWECVGMATHFPEDRENTTVSKTNIQVHRKGTEKDNMDTL